MSRMAYAGRNRLRAANQPDTIFRASALGAVAVDFFACVRVVDRLAVPVE